MMSYWEISQCNVQGQKTRVEYCKCIEFTLDNSSISVTLFQRVVWRELKINKWARVCSVVIIINNMHTQL